MSDEVAQRVLEVALADLEAEARKRTQAHVSDPPNLMDAARAWAALYLLERERKQHAALTEAYALLRLVDAQEEGLYRLFESASEAGGWMRGYREWRDRWLASGEDLLG